MTFPFKRFALERGRAIGEPLQLGELSGQAAGARSAAAPPADKRGRSAAPEAGRGRRNRSPALGSLAVDDQVIESGLDELAKPAMLGIGAAQIAAQQLDEKGLE